MKYLRDQLKLKGVDRVAPDDRGPGAEPEEAGPADPPDQLAVTDEPCHNPEAE